MLWQITVLLFYCIETYVCSKIPSSCIQLSFLSPFCCSCLQLSVSSCVVRIGRKDYIEVMPFNWMLKFPQDQRKSNIKAWIDSITSYVIAQVFAFAWLVMSLWRSCSPCIGYILATTIKTNTTSQCGSRSLLLSMKSRGLQINVSSCIGRIGSATLKLCHSIGCYSFHKIRKNEISKHGLTVIPAMSQAKYLLLPGQQCLY